MPTVPQPVTDSKEMFVAVLLSSNSRITELRGVDEDCVFSRP